MFSPASAHSSSILSGAFDTTERLSYRFTTMNNFFQLVSTTADNDYLAFYGKLSTVSLDAYF